ncbi:hypothetical protein TSOC_002423 [Tetrabaena socialis]|uniref:Uncharacterized protein n=1 Tax=Tetrabaena socialis TaxID=47790 RepID=A0A2J8AE36_9CHLO|nr:hypothetical protein TSOC_002423 [Tetrabaena socialis]|eukprot:PNH10788.1 hypothetical protein TSOC_002423 [Tetrabaena socialis]
MALDAGILTVTVEFAKDLKDKDFFGKQVQPGDAAGADQGVKCEHLGPSDIEQLYQQLGGNGLVDEQSFCDIAEAERIMDPGSDAAFLRRVGNTRPEWWSDSPACLDNSP